MRTVLRWHPRETKKAPTSARTMTTTRGAGRRLSVRPMPPTVGNVHPQDEVSENMGKRDEKQPPDPPLPVGSPLPQLDHREIESQGQREALDNMSNREEQQKQHRTGIVAHPAAKRNRDCLRPGIRRARDGMEVAGREALETE